VFLLRNGEGTISRLRETIARKWCLLGAAPVCSEHAERGIFIHGFCLPLCCRCTSILVGLTFAYAICLLNPESAVRHSPFMAFLLLPLLLDVALPNLALGLSGNQRRMLTGLLGGIAMPSIAHSVVAIIQVGQ